MASKFICAYEPCECAVAEEADFYSEACRYNAER